MGIIVILSAGVLTQEERTLAFAAVPEFDALRLNRNIALNLIDNEALVTIDALVGGFAREAFAAHLDAAHLLVRCAGQVAESKAGELYCRRAQPDGWIPIPADFSMDADQSERLRQSLQQIPLESAAMFLDASLNHAANAITRFALESGFAPGEIKELGLEVDQPVTPDNKWTSWGRVARALGRMETDGKLTARFELAQALLTCHRDPDLVAAVEYRHELVHRGVPIDLRTTAVTRPTGYATGPITIKLPIAKAPTTPDLEETRSTIARALIVCRQLQDAIHWFIPRWAAHAGFEIEIDGKDVAIRFKAEPSHIVTPPRLIHLPNDFVRISTTGNARVSIRERSQRDPNLFIVN
jgi:hypothetical protein